MQRQLGVRAVMEVGMGVHRRRIDTEEHHENPEEEMTRLIRKELGDKVLAPRDRILDGTMSPGRTSTGHPGQNGAEEIDRLGTFGPATLRRHWPGMI